MQRRGRMPSGRSRRHRLGDDHVPNGNIGLLGHQRRQPCGSDRSAHPPERFGTEWWNRRRPLATQRPGCRQSRRLVGLRGGTGSYRDGDPQRPDALLRQCAQRSVSKRRCTRPAAFETAFRQIAPHCPAGRSGIQLCSSGSIGRGAKSIPSSASARASSEDASP